MRAWRWVLAIGLLGGCFDPELSGRKQRSDGASTVQDGGSDASAEGGCPECDGSVTCEPACEPDAPVCHSGQCGGCVSGADCEAFADVPVCDRATGACVACLGRDDAVCQAQGQVCLHQGSTCVECNESRDCGSAEASRCDAGSHACVACSQDQDCAHVEGANVCLEGTCVQCTVETEEARCGTKSCDPATHACTETEQDSVEQCYPCVADSECKQNHRCIEMFFGEGEKRESLGGRCLRLGAAGCSKPYEGTPLKRESLSGAPAEEYCGISEVRTSCDAILQLIRGDPCGDADVCSTPGSLCRAVNNSLDNRCTYACESAATCPEDFPCPTAGEDKYCGKT